MRYKISSHFLKIIITCSPLFLYSLLLLDTHTIKLLTVEDGFTETIGAFCLFISSVFFLTNFKITRNKIYLLFALLTLFGCLEEISCGQRIIGFETPRIFKEYNRQGEFNIHNLKWFHRLSDSGKSKNFGGKLFNISRMFSLGWFSYFIIVPVLYKINFKVERILKKINLPIAPLFIGIAFLLNYLFSKMMENYLISIPNQIVEIKETNFEYLLALFGLYMLIKNINTGREPKSNILTQ